MGLLRGYAPVSRRLTCRREESISHKVYRPYDQLLFRSSFLSLPSMVGSTELQVLRERTAGCVRAWAFRGEEQTKARQMQRRSVCSGRRGGEEGGEAASRATMQCRRSMTEREEVSLTAESKEARGLAGRGRETCGGVRTTVRSDTNGHVGTERGRREKDPDKV